MMRRGRERERVHVFEGFELKSNLFGWENHQRRTMQFPIRRMGTFGWEKMPCGRRPFLTLLEVAATRCADPLGLLCTGADHHCTQHDRSGNHLYEANPRKFFAGRVSCWKALKIAGVD